MYNFSHESSNETFNETFKGIRWFCDRDIDKGTFLHLTFMNSLYVVIAITATLGNALILVALHKDTSVQPPSKTLLRSLTITDLCSGLVGQPLDVIATFSGLFKSVNICKMTIGLMLVCNALFSGISLLTACAISVDRLLALLLRLRYRQIVTVNRVRVVVVLFWLVGSGLIVVFYFTSILLASIITVLTMLLSLVISTYCYTRIFLTIRRQQMQLQDSHSGQTGGSGLNMARYKRTIFNALWVHLTLLMCYLPFVVVTALITVQGLSPFLSLGPGWAKTFVYLNSALNSALYCWKIIEVRQAVKETVRQFCACFST